MSSFRLRKMLNENRLSANDRAYLAEYRAKALQYDDYRDWMNAMHYLAINHRADITSDNVSMLYRLWMVETARVRTVRPHQIRWLRADWYGKASDRYTTSFKKYAQAIVGNNFDSRKDSVKMSTALSQLVANRVVDYKDLNLQDNTRNRKQSEMKAWSGIILGIEKNAMWTAELQKFCEALGIVVVTSGSGEPSRNSNEMIWDVVARNAIQQPVLLVVSDYDKYGFYIAHTFKVHLETYGKQFLFKRVGIDFTDLTPAEATPKAMLYELPNHWNDAIKIEGDPKEYGIEMDVKEWKFYFKKILDALLVMGFTIEDFDEWARKVRWARIQSAMRQAIEELIENDQTYRNWMGTINDIEKLIETMKQIVYDQLEPEVEPITDDPDFDDRDDETSNFITDLIKTRNYEERYSSAYLTKKLKDALVQLQPRIPTEEEVRQNID